MMHSYLLNMVTHYVVTCKVLILVVMDDALVLFKFEDVCWKMVSVLILVVMDDALVHSGRLTVW